MKYRKIEKDGYILGLAIVSENGNITEAEYNELTEIIRNKPIAPEGYDYHLTDSLKWELYELPTETTEPVEGGELTETEQKAQAYDIIMGVSE